VDARNPGLHKLSQRVRQRRGQIPRATAAGLVGTPASSRAKNGLLPDT